MPREHSASSSMSSQSTASVSAGLLVSLSYKHLSAAATFSRVVGEIERKHKDQPFGEFWTDIFSYSTACVLTAAASLEAYANELFFERETVFPGYTSGLLDALWETFERKSTREKFDFALLLRNRSSLVWGARPCRDVKAIVVLRDALLHYKPEWDNEAVRHKAISETLRGKFDPSPFLEDELIFPGRWASHSCTKWVVTTVFEFTTKFATTAGLPERFLRRLPDENF